MAERFDPYYKWLSIAPEDQPPTLYQLLGVQAFEEKPDVVESAADRQANYLRGFQSGQHPEEARQLLREIEQARLTLLDPVEKTAYDRQLRQRMQGSAPARVPTNPAPIAKPVATHPPQLAVAPPAVPPFAAAVSPAAIATPAMPAVRRPVGSAIRRRKQAPMAAVALVAGALLLLAIVVAAISWSDRSAPATNTLADSRQPGLRDSSRPSPLAKPVTGSPASPRTRPSPPARPPVAETPVAVPPIAETNPDPTPETSPDASAVEPVDSTEPKLATPAPGDLARELTIEIAAEVAIEMVLIPAGEFLMGSSKEEQRTAADAARGRNDSWARGRLSTESPQHQVTISRPFYLGKYEVTQAQWQAVMGSNPSKVVGPRHPVETVSWDDIQPFLDRLNHRSLLARTSGVPGKMEFALPSEAQWEYACRAGTTTVFYFGDDAALFPQYGWGRENANDQAHPVGQAKPNAWGLYDMHGNVYEWCSDRFGKDYYATSPTIDPPGASTGTNRIFRGGSCNLSNALCRSATRGWRLSEHSSNNLGFRLALTWSPE